MNRRLAALDFITGCLGIRDASEVRESLHSTVVSGRLDWPTVLDIAHSQKIAPALWVALRNRKLVEQLPPDAREHLFKIYLLNTLKNRGFQEQAIAAIRQLNSMGIEPILLKGSASLFVKTFDDPGSRVMVDLDILAPKTSAEECWNKLRTLGYSAIDNDFDYAEHHHLKPLYRPGKYGTIEIHRDALPASAARVLPTALIWEQSEPVVNDLGIVMRVPSPTHRVLHNLLHSNLIDEAYVRGLIPLRSLHELVMMQTLYPERLDWETMGQLMARGGQAKVLRAALYLAHRWFGSPMPAGIRPTPATMAHYARTRLQVRWDWIHGFVDRALWFSTPSICERYGCDRSAWSVAKGRMKLATFLAGKYSRQLVGECFTRIARQQLTGAPWR